MLNNKCIIDQVFSFVFLNSKVVYFLQKNYLSTFTHAKLQFKMLKIAQNGQNFGVA